MSNTTDIELYLPILRNDEPLSKLEGSFQVPLLDSPRKKTYTELIEVLIEFLYNDTCKMNPPFRKEYEPGKFKKHNDIENKTFWTWSSLDENDDAFRLQCHDPNVVIRVEDNVATVTINEEQTKFTKEENSDTFSYICKIYENLKERKRRDDRRYVVDSIDQLREGEKR